MRDAVSVRTGHHQPDGSVVRPPVAIGGVGGSGTRLVAQMLEALGFRVGTDLNHAHDNLWFTLLFKRAGILRANDRDFDQLLEIFHRAMQGGPAFGDDERLLIDALANDGRNHADVEWLRARAESLKAAPGEASPVAWGWKEPNTHIVLDRLLPRLPGMKFIQVVRNGLDMAYSRNQNQLKLWGPHFLGRPVEDTPHDSLRYWCIVHRRVLEVGAAMGQSFLWLDYDALCADPDAGVGRLCAFLRPDADEESRRQLRSLVQVPPTSGRHRQHTLDVFDADDVEWVRSRGFRIGG